VYNAGFLASVGRVYSPANGQINECSLFVWSNTRDGMCPSQWSGVRRKRECSNPTSRPEWHWFWASNRYCHPKYWLFRVCLFWSTITGMQGFRASFKGFRVHNLRDRLTFISWLDQVTDFWSVELVWNLISVVNPKWYPLTQCHFPFPWRHLFMTDSIISISLPFWIEKL
jgi:hypothetical protein